jgi:hypothetical protein
MTYMKMGQVLPDKVVYYDLVVRLDDLAFIPFDERNSDYQNYLAWVELGNKPLDFDPALLEQPAENTQL